MDFEYSHMYKFYRSFGDPRYGAFAHMYEAVKYNGTAAKEGPSAPFIVRSMQVRRVPNGDKLSDGHVPRVQGGRQRRVQEAVCRPRSDVERDFRADIARHHMG